MTCPLDVQAAACVVCWCSRERAAAPTPTTRPPRCRQCVLHALALSLALQHRPTARSLSSSDGRQRQERWTIYYSATSEESQSSQIRAVQRTVLLELSAIEALTKTCSSSLYGPHALASPAPVLPPNAQLCRSCTRLPPAAYRPAIQMHRQTHTPKGLLRLARWRNRKTVSFAACHDLLRFIRRLLSAAARHRRDDVLGHIPAAKT